MYDDILVPTDGSEGVQQAIEQAIGLASVTDATIHALYVVDTADRVPITEADRLTIETALEEAGERAVADVADRAGERGVNTETAVRHGVPHEEIVSYAEENGVDLIVMGTHGRSGMDRILLGSVTDNVIRRAEIPVLVKQVSDAS